MRFYLNLVLLALITLLVSGCASLRESTAGWLGQTPAPATVAGLNYAEIEELGALDDACSKLANAHAEERYLSERKLNDEWLPACRQRIESARESRRLDRLVATAYEEQQAYKEEKARQREEREQVRRNIEAARKDAEAHREASDVDEAQSQLRERLSDAHILTLLEAVPDQPLAFAVGQSSERSMKYFLACLEVGYPNQGYEINRGDKSLTVTARQANMLRGDVDIRAHFEDVWDTWMLESLSVAEVTARTPQDRFMLVQNLLAGHCNGIDDLNQDDLRRTSDRS